METFFPRYRKERLNRPTSQPAYTFEPLFTGYLFARFAAREMSHKIRYTRGVHSIVSIGGRPAPLDDGIIELIMSRGDGNGLITLEDEIKSGDSVVVNGGVFSGLVGIFDRRMKDSERVVILLNTVYQFCIVVPGADVKKRVD